VHLRCGGRSVLFSGDLGRSDDLVMKPPASARGRGLRARRVDLRQPARTPGATRSPNWPTWCAARPHAAAWSSCRPSRSVARRSLLHAIRLLKTARRIPDLPVFLDSPMGRRT
jgi:metallo-beta-lactamase family protein